MSLKEIFTPLLLLYVRRVLKNRLEPEPPPPPPPSSYGDGKGGEERGRLTHPHQQPAEFKSSVRTRRLNAFLSAALHIHWNRTMNWWADAVYLIWSAAAVCCLHFVTFPSNDQHQSINQLTQACIIYSWTDFHPCCIFRTFNRNVRLGFLGVFFNHFSSAQNHIKSTCWFEWIIWENQF